MPLACIKICMFRILRSPKPLLLAALVLAPVSLSAAGHGLFGDWKTTDGSVVRTIPCARGLCIKIVAIAPSAPGNVDNNNPEPALRKRSLCNLEIGSAFTLASENQATGGRLYDPESGKTYKGNIDLAGDTLKLRGYIGITVFGRTETWHRAADVKPCS